MLTYLFKKLFTYTRWRHQVCGVTLVYQNDNHSSVLSSLHLLEAEAQQLFGSNSISKEDYAKRLNEIKEAKESFMLFRNASFHNFPMVENRKKFPQSRQLQ